jgi:hypothetical protein
MKLTFKAEVSWPSWLHPAAHIAISSGGMVYLQHIGTGVVTTAATLAVGMSYGQLMTGLSDRGKTSKQVRR